MNIIALDIGGTSIKSGILMQGNLLEYREYDANAKEGGEQLMRRAVAIIKEYSEDYDFDRIGISTAGQVEPVQGSILYANSNIPDYTGMPVKRLLEKEFLVPVSVENDGNAAALGEGIKGAGKGEQEVVCLTFGTGVGGGILLHGQLYRGKNYAAAEFGRMPLHPTATRSGEIGEDGCYERYASVTALVRQAEKVDKTLTDGRKIFARLGERKVKETVDIWIGEILTGLFTINCLFAPSCIVLGGGIMEESYILTKIQEEIAAKSMTELHNPILRKAELGNKAGLLGACILAESMLESSYIFGR